MKHVVVCEFGSSLGVTSERMTVKNKGELIAEYPLARLHTVTVAKPGVSISSNLVLECSQRGIRLFFLNGRGECTAVLSGLRSHGVGLTRRHQILFLEDAERSSELAMRVTYGKIRNQRATLCYFAKSEGARRQGTALPLLAAAEALKKAADNAVECAKSGGDVRDTLLGIEGSAASLYWKAWIDSGLLPESFTGRTGRGGEDSANTALNYGYGVLSSFVWNAVLVAGLEPYLGFNHVQRPGKPSLVLDLMEEYRAWCHVRRMPPGFFRYREAMRAVRIPQVLQRSILKKKKTATQAEGGPKT